MFIAALFTIAKTQKQHPLTDKWIKKMYVYTYTYIYAYMYLYTHIYVYNIHTHTYTQ